jgi:hypothetical protein
MAAVGLAAKQHPWDSDSRYPYWVSIVRNSQHSAALWKAGAGGYWGNCTPWGGVRLREVADACQRALMQVAQQHLALLSAPDPDQTAQTG